MRQFQKALLSLAVAAAVSANPATAAQLEEIVVTAQKRTESLQDVPISITAVTGERMFESGINNMEDLSNFVPGLTVSKNAVNTNIYMRGLGSGNNRGFEQSVGMYIDGIYMGRGRQYRSPFLDVERVEVLRGPQGILFGKNTIAGAINITTARPDLDEELNGQVTLEYEHEYNTQIATGIISGALGENFSARLSGRWHETDGYVENTFLDEDAPEVEENTLRLSTVWGVTDTVTVTTKIERSNFETTGNNVEVKKFALLDNPKGALATPAYFMSLATDPSLANSDVDYEASIANPNLRNNDYNQDTGQDNEITNFVMNVNWELDGHTITSVTGYSGYDAEDQGDVDFLPIDFIPRYDDRQYDQWSQELRLVSDTGGAIDYIIGLYAQSSELDLSGHVSVNIDGATGVGLPLDLDMDGITDGVVPWNYTRVGSFEQDAETYAAFAQATWHINDSWRITGGLRYSYEEKEIDKDLYIADFNDVDTPLGLADGTVYSIPLSSTGGTVSADVPAGALAHQVWGSSLNTYAHGGSDFEVDRDEDVVTPLIKVQWDPNDNWMLYATATQGFKGGGFNANDNAAVPDGNGNIVPFQLDYDKEEADSFEIGGKAKLLDGAAEFNFAIFYTEFDDLQVSTFDGLSFKVGNAATATTQGVEIDGRWAVSDSITIGGNAAYLDSEFDDFETASCTVVQVRDSALANTATCEQDLSDEPTNYAPEWSGNLFAEYYTPIGDSLALRLGVDMQYSDWFYTEGDNDPDSVQDDYTKFNARIALSDIDSVWEIAVVGRNLTDEETYNGTLDVPLVEGSHIAFVEPPRTITVQARYNF